MWPPSDVCWFRFAPVTSSLFAHHVYHSEIGVINAPAERYRGRGHHLVYVYIFMYIYSCIYNHIYIYIIMGTTLYTLKSGWFIVLPTTKFPYDKRIPIDPPCAPIRDEGLAKSHGFPVDFSHQAMDFMRVSYGTRWCHRSIAKLAHITPITMVFVGDISIVNGVYKPIYNVWGAPPCRYLQFRFLKWPLI